MTTTRTPTQRDTLPLPALIVLSVIGFTTMLTETIPAGLLSDIGSALATSDSLTGQLLTAYAVASMVAAIPLTTLTRSWPRKPPAAGSRAAAATPEYLLVHLVRELAQHHGQFELTRDVLVS